MEDEPKLWKSGEWLVSSLGGKRMYVRIIDVVAIVCRPDGPGSVVLCRSTDEKLYYPQSPEELIKALG